MTKSIGIIPLRKGSKGIPGKNKKKLLGRPLYQWVLTAAIESGLDEIYIFSDDEEIKLRVESDYLWSKKVRYIERSEVSATDTASTELAILELAEKIDFSFDIICLLQATSPLTSTMDIDCVLNELNAKNYDSALTVVASKRFIWSTRGESLNYDYLNRPRRQDFEGLLIENGAVYAIKREMFLSTKNRLGGKISVVEMSEDSLIEIDEPSDWILVEQLLTNRMISSKVSTGKIKGLVLDVDGVFTEGKVITGTDKEIGKSFSLRDGMGFELAREAGLEIIVMTSEDSPIVTQRMSKLKIEHYYKGVKDKYALLNHVSSALGLYLNELAYIGDDINDLSNMLRVNWSFAPANAVSTIRSQADIVLHNEGGDMAIREAIDWIIKWNKRFV